MPVLAGVVPASDVLCYLMYYTNTIKRCVCVLELSFKYHTRYLFIYATYCIQQRYHQSAWPYMVNTNSAIIVTSVCGSFHSVLQWEDIAYHNVYNVRYYIQLFIVDS